MEDMEIETTAEGKRLIEARSGKIPWRLWGPYLSERQWGTVREDYSAEGNAWEYFPHDHARSRAYRWGEDGLAGISDEKQLLCFAISMWNGNDPFLKERLFGLTGPQGNHGEDVKEYCFYIDNVPTHSYMKYLYKYPQKAFPYEELISVNQSRTRKDPEYELLDTGIFDDNRYFDVFIEYAKKSSEDIQIRIEICNRGSISADLTLLPTLWFRNTWSWEPNEIKPSIELAQKGLIKATHSSLGDYWLYCENPDTILFTENETNNDRLFQAPNDSPYVKDSINDYITKNQRTAVNPNNEGTKASAVYHLKLAAGESQVIKLRLSNAGNLSNPFDQNFDQLFLQRIDEADDFYLKVTPYDIPADMRLVQRQAFAGLLWNKQCYHYNVHKWLKGDSLQPPPPSERKEGRNKYWKYLDAFDIFSMPDKWEYPWFAAWDLAFHTISLAMIDPEFAKQQLILLTREWYMSPDGQIPAYEWKFSDVNPPVHAWAAIRIYQIERTMYGREDREFLERVFQKLMLNFTWWVNRKDKEGRNIFEGGFLGLDNIGAFDRSLGPPSGGYLEQPDATGWMGMYCLNCLNIALELAVADPVYEDIATKFFEHFVYIGDAINNVETNAEGLWNHDKGFYCSVLVNPNGDTQKLYQESMVGIVPLFAVATNDPKIHDLFPAYHERFRWFVEHRQYMLKQIATLDIEGPEKRVLLAFANSSKLSQMLKVILDEERFLSPYGIRSVSKMLAKVPFTITLNGKTFKLDYEPAESTTSLFGGNSNWRGPIWFPLNFLLIESLQKFDYYFGDDMKVECPKGSGNIVNLWDVSMELSYRLISIFLKDKNGQRPVYGKINKFQNDPHWRDYIHFHEYFNGDNGSGLGASNQTGWTSLVAKLIHQYGKYAIAHVPARTIEKEKVGHI
jgi:hypothetical protein